MPSSPIYDREYESAIHAPVKVIMGLAAMVSNPNCTLEKRIKCVEKLRDCCALLLRLMKNMLTASRLDAGQIELRNVDFDVVKLAQEAVLAIAPQIAEKNLGLHVYIAHELPVRWRGDPKYIRHILLHLLNNAVHFTDEGQVSIAVDARPDAARNNQLRITVADTGRGMSEGALKRILGRYINRDYGIGGLGLYISQGLARKMRGNIAMESRPGAGSRFVLMLPLKQAAAPLNNGGSGRI